MVAREHTVNDFKKIEIIQAFFTVQDMVRIGKYTTCTCREYEFYNPTLKIAFYSLVMIPIIVGQSSLSALCFS